MKFEVWGENIDDQIVEVADYKGLCQFLLKNLVGGMPTKPMDDDDFDYDEDMISGEQFNALVDSDPMKVLKNIDEYDFNNYDKDRPIYSYGWGGLNFDEDWEANCKKLCDESVEETGGCMGGIKNVETGEMVWGEDNADEYGNPEDSMGDAEDEEDPAQELYDQFNDKLSD